MIGRLLALVSLVFSALVSGEGLYLVPSEFVVSQGQRVSVTVEVAAGVAALRDATLFTPGAAYNITNLRRVADGILGDANVKTKGTLILSIRTAAEFAKALIVSEAPSDFYGHRLGLALEIVPEKNPADVRVPGELPLLVLLRGQALAGAVVKTSWGFAGHTDVHGRVVAPVTGSGVLRILATSSDGGLSSSLVVELR